MGFESDLAVGQEDVLGLDDALVDLLDKLGDGLVDRFVVGGCKRSMIGS